jgi:hypothetical protein
MRKPIYCVDWGDAFIDTDDFTEEQAKKTKPVMRRTVGFLIAENQWGYVLATDEYYKKDDGYAARMFVPKGMATKVTKYEPV